MAGNEVLTKLQERIATSFSYLDVLAWAVAMSGGTNFVGDSRQWSKVVHEARDKYPDLLGGIWFTERGFSEQLEDFFRVMARSGAMSFPNPRYERIEMPSEASDAILRDVPPGLKGHEERVKGIALLIGDLKIEG